MKRLLVVVSVVSLMIVALVGTAGSVLADPHEGNPGNDFVCPVIDNQAVGDHNPIAGDLGEGTYTVVPATSQANHMNVPDGATNGDGYGVPHDHTGDNAQSQPGDTDYTAIWNGDAPHDP